MRVAASLHAITDFGHDVVPFEDALTTIAGLGYEAVMLLDRPGNPALTRDQRPGCTLLDYAASDPDLVRQLLDSAGLAVSAFYRGGLSVASDAAVEASVGTLTAAVHLAPTYGTSVVVMNGGAAPRGTPTAAKDPALRRLAEVLTRSLAAGDAATRLAVDLHCGAVVETVADCERLFELARDPRVGVTLNIGHLTTNRQEGWRLITDHPDRVHVVAWKDHRLDPPVPDAVVWSVELGTGDAPFERYVEALERQPLQAEHLISFENLPLAAKPAALRRSRDYWLGLWSR